MNLNWQTSELAGSFHAADVVRRGLLPAEAPLAQALTGPVERLQEALQEERVPPATFWSHLLPLSATNISMQELANRALIKSIGQTEAAVRVIRIRELLYAIKDAAALSRPDEPNALNLEPLRQQWSRYGQGLLGRIAERIDPDLLVEEATVVGIHPARSGGGAAHLIYNLACIEVVDLETEGELPEAIRLAWLLSMLNLDVPCFGEKVRAGRLPMVASLAMLPVVLAAAGDLQLVADSQELLAATVVSWLPEAGSRITPLTQWWDTYQRLKPSWANALKALDLLLE